LKLIEELPQVELHATGEFKMGTPGYGVVIRTGYGVFNILKDKPTVLGSDNYEGNIELSNCKRFIKVRGPDVEYILDAERMKVSIFHINVRANRPDEGIAFSREHCVFGKGIEHIHGFKGVVFVQCPWVEQDKVDTLVQKYLGLREKQLKEAMNAK